jgi:AspT/YidE/YbjL antiporter-like protein
VDLFNTIFIQHSPLQAVIILSLICGVGMGLARMKIFGIPFGVTFVFFTGILAGHIGMNIDPKMLEYAQSFGLVLFVYALGLQVGPGFFSSFRKGGVQLNMLGVALTLIGTVMAIICHYTLNVSMADMDGILCGATTNTPALGAAQQTLSSMGQPISSPALGCALTYPLGVIGVILAILLMRKIWVKPEDMPNPKNDHPDHTYIAEFQVFNPGIFDKSIKDIACQSSKKFVISRLWRNGKVSIPTSETKLQQKDQLLVITNEEDVEGLTMLFGEQEDKDWNKENIDWNAIDAQLISQHIVVTRPEINGKKLGALRLRNHYGINISRVYRSGVQLLATSELILQMGDRLTVVGEQSAIDNVEKVLGNTVKKLKEPNLMSVFIGMVIGLIVGSIPLNIPGISSPLRLGLAGGPIIIGILIGAFGPRLHMITYTTRSANLMLRGIGLSMYLACLGLQSGVHFFETVVRPEGLLWVAIGFLITIIPVLITGLIGLKICKLDFGTVSGMLSGSMANPIALNYANESIPGDHPSVSYATVYPFCMFVRVIIAQLLLMIFI